ncbi:MAG: hypothetical protein M3285_10540 [Actinomycetota bacterium]|nr:hypothetical protein [Actinomycetota bacterium]
MNRVSSFLVVVLIAAGACASGDGDSGSPPGAEPSPATKCSGPFQQPLDDVQAYPEITSSELTVGPNRVLIGVRNTQDAPIGSPALDVQVDFYDLEACTGEAEFSAQTEFVWTIEPVVGVYVAEPEFETPGVWGAEVTVSGQGLDETSKVAFQVSAKSRTPALGERPPATDNLTAADAKDLSEISTDKNPDPDFYEKTVAEALEDKDPFVVIFATPKFCQTQVCGPMLDIVKKEAKDFPDVTFIHIEPYELPADPAQLKAVEAAVEWNLQTEPWVFVMDGSGRVVSKYEAAISPEELRADLKDISK